MVTAAAGATGLAVIDVATNVLKAKVLFLCASVLRNMVLWFSDMDVLVHLVKSVHWGPGKSTGVKVLDLQEAEPGLVPWDCNTTGSEP